MNVNTTQQRLRQSCFDSIVRENRDRLGRIARVYAGCDAEDLVQEMLLQIWRSLAAFDQKSSMNTWCYRIALNTAISWQRGRMRAKRTPPQARSEVELLESRTSFTNEAELLQRFLESLGEVDRAVLVMYLDDLNTTEIAASVGTSEAAIRTRISRIRDRLKKWEPSDGGH